MGSRPISEIPSVSEATSRGREREAIETMRKSKMLRAAFGDDVVEHYVHTAEWEQFEYDRRITDWELKRGFARY